MTSRMVLSILDWLFSGAFILLIVALVSLAFDWWIGVFA